MYSPEINFKIPSLVKKTYEGGKLHSWYQNESSLKQTYMKNVRKGWLGLFLIVCMIAPFGLSSIYRANSGQYICWIFWQVQRSSEPFVLFNPSAWNSHGLDLVGFHLTISA